MLFHFELLQTLQFVKGFGLKPWFSEVSEIIWLRMKKFHVWKFQTIFLFLFSKWFQANEDKGDVKMQVLQELVEGEVWELIKRSSVSPKFLLQTMLKYISVVAVFKSVESNS